MKKVIFIVLVFILVTGFTGASGLDTHFGLGYNAQYFGEISEIDTDLMGNAQWMPYGIGGYAGVGYGFGARNMINIGAEMSTSMGIQFASLSDLYVGNITVQAKGYLKFKPVNLLTITAFGGYAYDFYGGSLSGTAFNFNGFTPVVGGRVTVLFLYAQYDVTLYEATQRHNFGLGFAFKK